MKKLLCLQMLLFLSFLPVVVKSQITKTDSSASKNWVGKYTYTYTEPANAGGWVPIIEYVLIVSQKGDSLIARLTADGYQSNDDYRYTAKAVGNRLNLYLSKVLNLDDGEPKPGRRFVKGKLSEVLVKSTIRGRTKYVFKSETFFGSKFAPVFKKKS